MGAHNFIKDHSVAYAGAAVAAGSSIDNNSTRFDMANYEGVCFFTAITDCADTGVATLTVEENSSDSDTGMTAISGASDSATSAADDDLNGSYLFVDVFRPQERYVQGVRTSATANIAFGEIYCIRYNPANKPVSDHSTANTATYVVGS